MTDNNHNTGYAKRRKKEQDIKQFLTNHMYHLVKDVVK